ncbi:MAG: DUF4255 domain-containing protein [Gammaproteobacteria bacterium]
MPDSSVIADVSETLEAFLTNAFTTIVPAPVAEVHDLQGAISTTPARMTIFLYEMIEDPSVRNRPPTQRLSGTNLRSTRTPVPLILRYLLTAWSGDRLTDHRIMGRAIQALHDDALLSGPQLQGGLAGTSEAIKLKLAPLTLEELTRVWSSVNQPYRLSVTYDVRVIRIDSNDVSTQPPVRSRTLTGAVGEVE